MFYLFLQNYKCIVFSIFSRSLRVLCILLVWKTRKKYSNFITTRFFIIVLLLLQMSESVQVSLRYEFNEVVIYARIFLGCLSPPTFPSSQFLRKKLEPFQTYSSVTEELKLEGANRRKKRRKSGWKKKKMSDDVLQIFGCITAIHDSGPEQSIFFRGGLAPIRSSDLSLLHDFCLNLNINWFGEKNINKPKKVRIKFIRSVLPRFWFSIPGVLRKKIIF